MLKKIKCIVACRNSCGEPDFYPCTVEVTQEEYDNGDHYDKAMSIAQDDGYEGITHHTVVYDEYDGPGFLFQRYFAEDGTVNTEV